MIRTLTIKNFKSIDHVELPLGRVNVFIGENGAGKSNILEAVAFAGAAHADKLDNEFLINRGVRVGSARFMRPGFDASVHQVPIEITIGDGTITNNFTMQSSDDPYARWSHKLDVFGEELNYDVKEFVDFFAAFKSETSNTSEAKQLFRTVTKAIENGTVQKNEESGTTRFSFSFALDSKKQPKYLKFLSDKGALSATLNELDNFVIFSPENSALRLFEKEGQIEPLGINGEGVLKLLVVIAKNYPEKMKTINASLGILGWFSKLNVVDAKGSIERRLEIEDDYLDPQHNRFDQRSANEGFLFLTFYFALFISELTPQFFAVDNIDASLNPKLCTKLMTILDELAKDNGKQVMLTTHNPAILDGLNLDDEEQRLFVVSRGRRGQTRVTRFKKPEASAGSTSIRLSEAFLRGSVGGLPKNF